MKQESQRLIGFSAEDYDRRADDWAAKAMAFYAGASEYYGSHDMGSQHEFNLWLHVCCEAAERVQVAESQRRKARQDRERHNQPSPAGDMSPAETLTDVATLAGMKAAPATTAQTIPLERLIMELDDIEETYKGFHEYVIPRGTPGAMYSLGMIFALEHIRSIILHSAEALADGERETQ